MSWLLKQAEDILNRVDQQTNAAINQHAIKPSTQKTNEDITTESSSTRNSNSTNRYPKENRRNKKNDDADLIDYLNSSTSVNKKFNRPLSSNNLLSDTTRTASTPDMSTNDSANTTEQLSSKSASGTPRSATPASAQTHDEDEGLVLVKSKNSY